MERFQSPNIVAVAVVLIMTIGADQCESCVILFVVAVAVVILLFLLLSSRALFKMEGSSL